VYTTVSTDGWHKDKENSALAIRGGRRIGVAVNHDHESGMSLKQIICERNEDDNTRWRCMERKTGKTFSERGYESSRKVSASSSA